MDYLWSYLDWLGWVMLVNLVYFVVGLIFKQVKITRVFDCISNEKEQKGEENE